MQYRYEYPKSQYVRNLINGKRYSNGRLVKKVNDLVRLEELICKGVGNWGASMLFGDLKSRYEKEYEIILKQIDPERYKKYKEEQRKSELLAQIEGLEKSLDDLD